jgi:hypothetical protein
MRTEVALLRFRVAAARCGEPIDHLSDEQLLVGLGRICSEGTFAAAALLEAGIERVGPEWAGLLETAQATDAIPTTKAWSGRSLRRRIWVRLREHLTRPP